VLLFDEVEKAHPDVFNMLLQVLDDGRLSDSQGRTVSFKNTLIVMTSNIGSSLIAGSAGSGKALTADDLMPEIRKFFRVEFVNRIDEIIAFQPLALEELVKVAALRFGDLKKRLQERGISAEITDKASRAIAELSHDPQFGARPINRFIQHRLENPLSRLLVAGALKSGTHLVVDFRDGDFLFNGKPADEAVGGGAKDVDAEDAEFTEV
jgi:ATP-dependent Clp protease ATP-binding subunit ClpA